MFAAIGFIIRYLPLIVTGVQMVENFVRPGTSGAEKQALAVRFIIQALEKLNVTVTDRTEEIIRQAINLIVTVFNAFGFFKSHEGEDADAVAVASEDAAATHIPAPVSPTDARLAELEAALRDSR
jgi:hypothetical protein